MPASLSLWDLFSRADLVVQAVMVGLLFASVFVWAIAIDKMFLYRRSKRAMDQFEQIYADAKHSARVMAITVHPYIMGAPHRAKYFRRIFEKIRKKRDVLFWNGEQILEWYLKVGPKPA